MQRPIVHRRNLVLRRNQSYLCNDQEQYKATATANNAVTTPSKSLTDRERGEVQLLSQASESEAEPTSPLSTWRITENDKFAARTRVEILVQHIHKLFYKICKERCFHEHILAALHHITPCHGIQPYKRSGLYGVFALTTKMLTFEL